MEKEINPQNEGEFTNHPQLLIKNVLATVVVVSLLVGSASGAFGMWFLLGTKTGQALLNKNLGSSVISQRVSVTEDSNVVDVVKQASPAVVSIVISKDISRSQSYEIDPFNFPFFGSPNSQPNRTTEPNIQQVGAGSGFLVSADGLILTNKHVVSDEEATYKVVTQDDKEYEAKVVARDPRNDLAILKIDIHNAPFLSLADSGSLEIGQRVIAIGNSLGQYHNTVTTGIVSGIGRSITASDQAGTENLEGVIQTDAAINPGNSGGPLLNGAGQVIGINTAIDREGQLVGFAIPSNDAQRSLDSYSKQGRIVRPYVGVRYVMVTPEMAKQEKLERDYGALVVHGDSRTEYAVIPNSPADKAGIVEGDIILEVEGKKLDKNMSLSKLIADKNVGDTISAKIFHRGQEKNIIIKLEELK